MTVKKVKFPEYQLPTAHGAPSLTGSYDKSAVMDFGIGIQRYFTNARWHPEDLEWFTGEKASPTQQHMVAAALVLALLEASLLKDETVERSLPKVPFIAQFTSPIDRVSEGLTYGTMNTVSSRVPGKFVMTTQPFQYNYAKKQFSYITLTMPKKTVGAVGLRDGIDALNAVHEALLVRNETELNPPVAQNGYQEPTNEELAAQERQSGKFWDGLKTFFTQT